MNKQEASMRECNRCGVRKPFEDFPRHRQARDGRTSICKDCTYAKVRQMRRSGAWGMGR